MSHQPQLPVFVYGTLRPGHGNYRAYLAGRTESETPARAEGLALYGRGIPYAIPTRGAVSVGTLVRIIPAAYTRTLRELDRLEGFHPASPGSSHYLRVQRTVTTGAGAVRAWIYLAGPHIRPEDLDPIPGNDWDQATAPAAAAGVPS